MPNIATRTPEVDRMLDAAELVRCLMAGTAAMRAAGEKYLPIEQRETRAAYDARLKRSTLFNAFGKTARDQTGRVFRKPIVLKDDVPEPIVAFAENIDLTGRHINVFARDVFFDALQTGITFILVDAPPADGEIKTVAQEKAAGRRPYIVHIPLERLIGWKSTLVNGVETLTQVRIKECVSEPDGEYAEKSVDQIRVLEPGKWRTFRKKATTGVAATDEWEPFEEGTSSLNEITLVPVYTNRTGFMTGSPPLAELADLNVAHYQSQSDQRNILHVARVPILYGAGFEAADTIEIGASSMVRTSNPDARLEYVEHSGQAISSGDKDLQNLEFQMQTMGLQLLVSQPGQTATGEIRDDAKEMSPLAMMAQALADALETALGFMAQYIGLGADAGGSVEVNTDFGVVGSADTTTLLSAVNAGQISRLTFWRELQRRAVLADDFDPEAEAQRLEAEDSRRSMNLGA
jgi:hypothetical protein